MIDVAKVADLVLLLIDASFGMEMETFEFLNICQVHGFPRIMGVLTHLDYFKNNKQLKVKWSTLSPTVWAKKSVWNVPCPSDGRPLCCGVNISLPFYPTDLTHQFIRFSFMISSWTSELPAISNLVFVTPYWLYAIPWFCNELTYQPSFIADISPYRQLVSDWSTDFGLRFIRELSCFISLAWFMENTRRMRFTTSLDLYPWWSSGH